MGTQGKRQRGNDAKATPKGGRRGAVNAEAPEVDPEAASDADEGGEAADGADATEVVAELEAAPDDPDEEADIDLDIELEPIEIEAGEVDRDALPDLEVEPSRQLPAITGARHPEALTALNIYLARLKTVEILPMEEQAALAVKFQETGDKEAAARLVASNLRLVVKIAFQFRRQWADVMDLVAEGNLGLAEAIRKFDAERKIPFPSYARYWIRARILAFIQENKHLIHAGSRAARKLFWRLDRERRQLVSEGLEPSPRLIAERVGITEADVRELAPILDQRAVSLDLPAHGDEDGRTRGDSLADTHTPDPEDAMGGGEVHDQLKAVFAKYRATLDEREQAIWDQRLMSEDPVRLEDLGDRFGVSKERVRQLEVRIKANLKDFVQRHLGSDVVIEALR